MACVRLLASFDHPTLGRMTAGKGTTKISITVPAEDLAWARRVAGKRKASLSLVISEALAAKRKEAARRSLSVWLAEGVVLDERELEELRREWQD